ncbi:ATP-binding protein [Streptomyces sp. NPDC049555]|uniref:ATP-binding protein n=1 Tax=unclassified Streptomyces TaxID=2593676 RepID=UPI00343C2819
MSNSTVFLPDPPGPEAAARPSPATFNYSVGLPGGAYCVRPARTLVRQVLRDHGLAELAELGTFAVSELLAHANSFTPDRGLHLSMRWRFGVLRLVVFDEHPTHPASAAPLCRERRREALSLLDMITAACGGICGLAELGPPLYGSKVWVVLPREAGELYAAL